MKAFACTRLVRCLPLAAALLGIGAHADETVRLATREWPPYQFLRDQKIQGSAVRTVECVLAAMNRSYAIDIFPWKRAQKLVENDTYHGFFAASHNIERDRYAVLSSPIAVQARSWYTLAERQLTPESEEFKWKYSVSADAASNMYNWLEINGYRVNTIANSSAQLFAQLLNRRTDAILVNEAVAHDYLQSVSPAMRLRLKKHKTVGVPSNELQLGVYFSKKFLARNPGFLAQFNSKVAACR